MSLETEISRLTAAIEKLNANIELVLTTPVTATVQPKKDEPVTQCEIAKGEQITPEPAVTPEVKAVTFKDVQDQCLALSRKSADNKNAIRALLDDFGAKKVSDLGDNLATFAEKLGRL